MGVMGSGGQQFMMCVKKILAPAESMDTLSSGGFSFAGLLFLVGTLECRKVGPGVLGQPAVTHCEAWRTSGDLEPKEGHGEGGADSLWGTSVSVGLTGG